MSLINPDCDGDKCTEHSEVRMLPTGGGANRILCHKCFQHEMAWRADENRRVANPYALTTWKRLKTYDPGTE